MPLQAILLFLVIFSSYLFLGKDTSSNEAPLLLPKEAPKENELNVIGQGADFLKRQAGSAIEASFALAGKLSGFLEKAKQKKIEEINAKTLKDFSQLSLMEIDSQMPASKIEIEKTEENSGSGKKCGLENEAFLKSRTVLLKYFDYNFNLFSFNSQKRWPIASLSKLMTAAIAAEKFDNKAEVKISDKAVATDGKTGGFKAGEIFSVDDLIKAMLVVSSNDAAIALAEAMNQEDFVALMNQKAKELGMSETYFEEPTGLSFLNQSTADDLSKLAAYIYHEHSRLLEISRQKEIEIIELKTKKPRKLFNINRFAGQADFIGGKTGYIDESGRNLISIFNNNDKAILTIVLGAKDAFEETKSLLKCVR